MTASVLVRTAGMSREQWLEARRADLGSSDTAAVVGLDPYKTRMQVWLDKTGQLPPTTSPAAELGRELEALVARKFVQATGRRVRRVNAILRHPNEPWMIADIDRVVVGGGILECKVTGDRHLREWEPNRVPDHYLVQVQHQLTVTGESRAWVAAIIWPHGLVIREVERDEEPIADLVRAERAFWHDHVLTQVPPQPDGSPAPSDLLARLYPSSQEGKTVVLPVDEADALIRQYLDATAAIREMERLRDEAANRLKAMMGDAELGYVAGRPRVKRTTVRASRLDAKALREAHPDIAAEFTRESTYRRFLVLGEEDDRER